MARPAVWTWAGKRNSLLPAFLLLFAVVTDLSTPRTVSAAALYAAAVLSAAPLLSLRGTILTGACALLADWAMLRYFGYRRDPVEISELAMVATVTVFAAFLNRLLYHQRAQLKSVRDIAAAVRHAVLPRPPDSIGSPRFAARYEAAQTDAQIRGDLYAVLDSPYGVRCMIGDVRGKGTDAVRSVAVGVATFREAALDEPSLAGLAERLERAVALEAEQSGHLTELEEFVTGVLAEFHESGTKVRLLNRGPPAPLLLDRDTASYPELTEPGMPLGLAALAPSPEHVDTLPFPEGATLLPYTDGLSESRNTAGAFYDPLTRQPTEFADLLRRGLSRCGVPAKECGVSR